MRVIIAIMLAILVAAPALAAPSEDNKGLARACERASSARPCEHLALGDILVGTGSTRTFQNGTYHAEGDMEVETGGTLVVDNATLRFGPDSDGILVHGGGTLVIKQSRLQEGAQGSAFVIDARAGSTLRLTGSHVDGGEGVLLATEDAAVHTNTLSNISVALRNLGVSVRIHHNAFVDNLVSVNNTGGAPTLDNNTFQGGDVCVRDWLSDPTIVHNVFRGCHVGIYHHRSESRLSFNDMSNDAYPPGGGIVVEDTMSPTIEGNVIAHYGTGILIKNARAYVRNNTVHSNAVDGIRIENNSAPMDIQGNVVHDNGRFGIALFNVTEVPVRHNEVYGHTAHAGIFVNVAALSPVEDNSVHDNKAGISVHNSPGMQLARNVVKDHADTGIWIGLHSSASTLHANVVENAGYGIWTDAHATSLGSNSVLGASIVGIMVKGSNSSLHQDSVTQSARGIGLVGVSYASLDQVSSRWNSLMGLWIDGGHGNTLVNVNASGNGGDGFLVYDGTSGVTLYGPRALANGGSGLRTLGGNSTAAHSAWWEGNSVAGVRNDDPDALILSEYAYWGSSNGPTHADNPGGDGDAVIGNVDYQPFLQAPPPPWSPPTFVA